MTPSRVEPNLILTGDINTATEAGADFVMGHGPHMPLGITFFRPIAAEQAELDHLHRLSTCASLLRLRSRATPSWCGHNPGTGAYHLRMGSYRRLGSSA
jgi:hypothetical protein